MTPLPRGPPRPVVGGEWSAPTHLSWVAGGGPVEPHTEVADYVRLYDDGNQRLGWTFSRLAAVRADELLAERTLPDDDDAVERALRGWPVVCCC